MQGCQLLSKAGWASWNAARHWAALATSVETWVGNFFTTILLSTHGQKRMREIKGNQIKLSMFWIL